jgi:hypothetical protein
MAGSPREQEAGDSENWSPAYATAIEELGEALHRDGTKPKLRERVARLLTLKFTHFVDVRVYGVPAPTLRTRYVLEPRNRLLALTAAVRANDGDQITLIEHESAP